MEKNNSLVPQKQFKGVVPIVKSFLFGTESGLVGGPDGIQNTYTTQTFFERLVGWHSFNREGLQYLVETGYTNNPIGFGGINKILLAQRNIVFTPYWKGKPYKSKSFDFDVNYALQMLITTGTCIVYKQNIIGFGQELKVLNTLHVQEQYRSGKFQYKLNMLDGSQIGLITEDMIFIKFADISSKVPTNFGVSPLQAALMPIESLKYMYQADTASLKNSGVNGILTNDSGEILAGVESDELQAKLNKQLGGARKTGQIAASTIPLRFIQLGKTAKEFALWDGYKIKNRDFCTVLQLDSGQMNDPDNKKFSNVQESNKALYSDCVIPFTRLITENKEILDFLGYEIYLDTSNIDCLQTAQKERADKAQSVQTAVIELNSNVGSGTITYDTAIKILVSEWGFDEEEAKGYIKIPIQTITATNPDQPITE